MDKKLRIILDIDGVISTNPQFFSQLSYFFTKRNNQHEVYILTARNPKRRLETYVELEKWDIYFNEVLFMPSDLTRDFTTQGKWKKDTVQALNADLWFDNDFKWYEKECGIDFSDLKCTRIEI